MDDDTSVLEALHLTLDEHYDVLEAHDGDTALTLIQSRDVDLVLLDLLIGGLDGIAVLERLRARRIDVPVVIVSGINSAWTAAAAMRLGAVDYVTKPYDETEFLQVIAFALRRAADAAPLSPAQRAPRILLIGCPVGMTAALTIALSAHARVETMPLDVNALGLIPPVIADIVVIDVENVPNPSHVLERVKTRVPLAPFIVLNMPPRNQNDQPSLEADVYTVLPSQVSLRDLLKEVTAELRPSGCILPCLSSEVIGVMDGVSRHFAAATVHELGWALGKSPYYLSRLFRAETGMTLKTYVNRVRVEAARQLLLEPTTKLETVAGMAGFHDASHLSRAFMKYFGQRPRGFHRIERGGPTRPAAAPPPQT